jgi:hypothetical protein
MSLNTKQQALWEIFKPKPSPELKDGELKVFHRIVEKITVTPLDNDLIAISYEKLSREEHLVIEPSWGLLNLPDGVKAKIKALDDPDALLGNIALKPALQAKLVEAERKDLLRKLVFKSGRETGSRNTKTQDRHEILAKLISSRPTEKVEVLFGDDGVKEIIGDMSLSNFSKCVRKIRNADK